MRFSGPDSKQHDEGAGFFITEDVRQDGNFPNNGVEQIQEEKSYGSETGEERHLMAATDKEKQRSRDLSKQSEVEEEAGQLEPPRESDLDGESVFDFGRAKMEFFK